METNQKRISSGAQALNEPVSDEDRAFDAAMEASKIAQAQPVTLDTLHVRLRAVELWLAATRDGLNEGLGVGDNSKGGQH
jgi:hypothetical protein